MIQGKAAITQYFESIAQPYFAIFYKGQVEKGNPIFRNDKEGEKEYTHSEGKQVFERTLELLGYGDYTVIISDKKNVTNRGHNKVDFKIGLNDAAPVQQTVQQVVSGIGAVSMEEVERRANEIATKRFTELMNEKELRDTKARNAELEKELREAERKVNDPVNKFLQAAAPHSEHIISGLFGTGKAPRMAPVVSGVEADNIEGPEPQAQQVIEDFIQALAERKPDEWQAILQRLTGLIKTDPEKFETALKFL